jgi:hypothetical protein
MPAAEPLIVPRFAGVRVSCFMLCAAAPSAARESHRPSGPPVSDALRRAFQGLFDRLDQALQPEWLRQQRAWADRCAGWHTVGIAGDADRGQALHRGRVDQRGTVAVVQAKIGYQQGETPTAIGGQQAFGIRLARRLGHSQAGVLQSLGQHRPYTWLVLDQEDEARRLIVDCGACLHFVCSLFTACNCSWHEPTVPGFRRGVQIPRMVEEIAIVFLDR